MWLSQSKKTADKECTTDTMLMLINRKKHWQRKELGKAGTQEHSLQWGKTAPLLPPTYLDVGKMGKIEI